MGQVESIQKLNPHVNQYIIGQQLLVDRLLIALLCDGHLLVEGAPGLAKTRAIKVLSEAIEGDFHRIQFTPDLLPADLTGTEVFRQQTGTFVFQKGPLFHNLILADEINRAPAKVQSALLEAMAERQITVGMKTYPLPPLFLVMATQNPIEQEGTYPLPEAQLDRFMFNLWLDYPSFDEEKKIVETTTSEYKAELSKVVSADEIILFQDLVRRVPVSDNVTEFAVKAANLTRPTNGSSPQFIKDWITWGAGPRASQYLIMAAKTRAVINGRYTPNLDDVKLAMTPVLRHRIITNFSAEADGITSVDVIEKLVKELD